ncbi:hypothetical protein IV102_00485 [bacterium]|nr:hypothetical protein [bacterium]
MTKKLFVPLLLGMCLNATAQPQDPKQVLLLPLETTGNYAPLDDDKMARTLQARLQQLSPKAQFQAARGADLTAYQYNAAGDAPPTSEQAETMGRAYQANYICWADVHFQPSFDGGTLALAGAARVWVYSTEQHKVVMDQPMSLVRTGKVKNVKDASASQKLASTLAEGCINDLAVQMVAVAQSRTSQARASSAEWNTDTPPPAFKGSANYDAVVRAIKDYQRGASSDDYISVNEAEQQLGRLWTTLNKQEMDQLSQAYPSIVQMMNNPPAYGYGTGYWPYYYNRGYAPLYRNPRPYRR